MNLWRRDKGTIGRREGKGDKLSDEKDSVVSVVVVVEARGRDRTSRGYKPGQGAKREREVR